MAYAKDLSDFLEATYTMVPAGEEDRRFDWDTELRRLTAVN